MAAIHSKLDTLIDYFQMRSKGIEPPDFDGAHLDWNPDPEEPTLVSVADQLQAYDDAELGSSTAAGNPIDDMLEINKALDSEENGGEESTIKHSIVDADTTRERIAIKHELESFPIHKSVEKIDGDVPNAENEDNGGGVLPFTDLKSILGSEGEGSVTRSANGSLKAWVEEVTSSMKVDLSQYVIDDVSHLLFDEKTKNIQFGVPGVDRGMISNQNNYSSILVKVQQYVIDLHLLSKDNLLYGFLVGCKDFDSIIDIKVMFYFDPGGFSLPQMGCDPFGFNEEQGYYCLVTIMVAINVKAIIHKNRIMIASVFGVMVQFPNTDGEIVARALLKDGLGTYVEIGMGKMSYYVDDFFVDYSLDSKVLCKRNVVRSSYRMPFTSSSRVVLILELVVRTQNRIMVMALFEEGFKRVYCDINSFGGNNNVKSTGESGNERLLYEDSRIHHPVIRLGWSGSDPFMATALVDFYSTHGDVEGWKSFYVIPSNGVILWSSMFCLCGAKSLMYDIVAIPYSMQLWGDNPSASLFLAIPCFSSSTYNFQFGEQVQCCIIISGLVDNSAHLGGLYRCTLPRSFYVIPDGHGVSNAYDKNNVVIIFPDDAILQKVSISNEVPFEGKKCIQLRTSLRVDQALDFKVVGFFWMRLCNGSRIEGMRDPFEYLLGKDESKCLMIISYSHHSNIGCKYLANVQHEMLTVCVANLLDNEHSIRHALFSNDKVDDLSRMYRSFSKFPKGLDHVASIFPKGLDLSLILLDSLLFFWRFTEGCDKLLSTFQITLTAIGRNGNLT